MSSVMMKPEDVIRLANERLQRREERIQAARERMIEAAMKPRWFGLVRPRTREEAIAWLSADFWGEYSLLSISGGLLASRLTALRDAAELLVATYGDSSPPLQVDTSIAAALKG